MAACAYSPPRTRATLLCCFLLAASQASARPIVSASAGRSLLQQPGTATAGVSTALRGAASATPMPQPTTQPLNSQVSSHALSFCKNHRAVHCCLVPVY